jgi:lysophospholipase L1-like esterase
MNRSRLIGRVRRGTLAALWSGAILSAGVAPSPVGATDAAVVGYPTAIAATGDSITRAFNTGGTIFTDAPGNSWATGTNSAVNSQYNRILTADRLTSVRAYNDAQTGAKMVDLNGQILSVNGQGVDYITILLGANDACTPSEAAMTDVATYRAQFQQALNTLTAGSPNARIFVASVPDVYKLWDLLKDNTTARIVWYTYSICQSMLANPTSTAPADVDRRARVRQRVVDYNTQLAQVCATNVHCRFDNNATFNTIFATADVSTRDYFHPSLSGQALLAGVTYGATFDFRDRTPPVTKAASTPVTGGLLVTLSAADNVGVNGIEYKLGSGAYSKYTAPVTVASGSSITFRAVDVNGNSEASQTMSAP